MPSRFKNPDFDAIKALLNHPVVIDGRKLYVPVLMQSLGIEFIGIGRTALPFGAGQSGSRRSQG